MADLNFTIQLKLFLIKKSFFLLNGTLKLLQNILWTNKKLIQPNRIGIYKIGNIGDIICALPAMFCIRRAFPKAEITLITSPGKRGNPGAEGLLEGAEWIDNLYVYYKDQIDTVPKTWELIKDFRRRKFDLWIELPGNLATFRTALRNMVTARLSGAKWAFGWRINHINWATQVQSEHYGFPNEVDRALEILKDAGIDDFGVKFSLPLNSGHRDRVNKLLESQGLNGKSLVAIAPGAKRSTNRWPPERFAKVARYLCENGNSVVTMGGTEERELCGQVLHGIAGGAANLAGETTLLESVEVLSRCRLLVCNDSGVQHMAAAVGIPSISIFSYRDIKGKWFPYGVGNKVLQEWVECHSCFLETCPHENKCLTLIDVPRVIKAIIEITSRK